MVKVSVCVSTYNHVQYIEECLTSILSQKTDFDFEVLVGDDNSGDGTREIIIKLHEQYRGILKPIFHDPNIGSAQNYNYLHKVASGEYVCHCDGDDLFLPGKLQKQADYLDKHPQCSVAWHKVIMFDDAGHEGLEYNHKDNSEEGEIVTIDYLLRVGTVAAHSSIMYRKKAKLTYEPNFVALDLYYSIEFLRSGYGIILKNVLGKYRINSSTSYSTNSKSALFMRRLCAQHWDYYRTLFPQHRSQIFIFSIINFLIDAANCRKTSFDFFKLAFNSVGGFSIKEFKDSLESTKYLRLPKLK